MPSRTPYTDILHTTGVLITRNPLPEGDEHPFDRPFGEATITRYASTSSTNGNQQVISTEQDEFDLDDEDDNREVLMPVEDIDNVLYLNEDDIADGDESQRKQKLERRPQRAVTQNGAGRLPAINVTRT